MNTSSDQHAASAEYLLRRLNGQSAPTPTDALVALTRAVLSLRPEPGPAEPPAASAWPDLWVDTLTATVYALGPDGRPVRLDPYSETPCWRPDGAATIAEVDDVQLRRIPAPEVA